MVNNKISKVILGTSFISITFFCSIFSRCSNKQVYMLCEHIKEHMHFLRSFKPMNFHMLFKITADNAFIVTKFAFIWLFTCVYPHMIS